MNKLRAILDRISDIEATITRFISEGAPSSDLSYSLTLQSLENRRDAFKEELAEITRLEQIEVCDYRIIANSHGSYALAAVTSALREFQDLVTIVYDAITSKPKQRYDIKPDVVQKTQFEFGFSYAGSLGIALTIPNQRLLAINSELDDAIKAVFSLLESKTAENIKVAESKYGAAAIKKLYKWSKAHKDYNLGADIKWVRERETRFETAAESAVFSEICSILEKKSEIIEEMISLRGYLVAWNASGLKFIMQAPDSEPISGTISKNLDISIPREVNGISYDVKLKKYTQIIYTSDKNSVSWELIELTPLN